MSTSGGTFSAQLNNNNNNNRRRRRPYPDSAHRAGNRYHGHTKIPGPDRRFQADGSLPALTPNYPSHPFGDISKEALLQAVVVRRQLPKKDVSKSTYDGGRCLYRNNLNQPVGVRGDANNLVSSMRGSEERPPEVQLYGGDTGREDGTSSHAVLGLKHPHIRHHVFNEKSRPSSKCHAEENDNGQVISSGPSAVDLFDQCGIIPAAAIEMKGLVGTIEDTGISVLPFSFGLSAARPPLVPEGASGGSRGARSHKNIPGRPEARPRNATKSSQVVTTGQTRPPFSGGSLSAAPQDSQQGQGGVPERRAGYAKASGSARRGVRNVAESTRVFQEGRSDAGPEETELLTKTNRVRRRWNLDNVSVDAPVPPPPRAGFEIEALLSEKRLSSAKVRLQKNKDLEALKSEHVEALSILQNVSCPSTTAARSVTEDDGELMGDFQTTRGGIHERGQPSATVSGRGLVGGPARVSAAMASEMEFGPAGEKIDALSSNLPRIGSREEAALRSMYRNWWIKVANGGSPPSSSTIDLIKVSTTREAGRCRRHNPQGSINGDGGGLINAIPPTFSQITLQGAAPKNNEENTPSKSAELWGGEGARSNRTSSKESTTSAATVVEPQALRTAVALERSSISSTPEEEVDMASGRSKNTTDDCNHPVAVVKKGMHRHSTSPFNITNNGTATCVPVASTPSRSSNDTLTPTSGAQMEEDFRSCDKSDYPFEFKRGPLEEAGRMDTMPSPSVQLESDVDSVLEDNGLEAEEEGHHGRIYLPDGRFVSTRRVSLGLEDDDISNDDPFKREKVEVASEVDDAMLEYANESFEV